MPMMRASRGPRVAAARLPRGYGDDGVTTPGGEAESDACLSRASLPPRPSHAAILGHAEIRSQAMPPRHAHGERRRPEWSRLTARYEAFWQRARRPANSRVYGRLTPDAGAFAERRY